MLHFTTYRRNRSIGAAIFAAAALTAGLPAVAGAACSPSPTSTAFAQFGDGAAYSLAPGGSFEAGAPGWSLTNSSVVSGNESYNIVEGTHSLAIAGEAVSPPVCIGSEYPSFRIFARQLSGDSAATLSVRLRWVSLLGLNIESQSAALQSSGDWAPSPVMALGSSNPLWLPGGSAEVRLVFQPSMGSSWAIDDVFIDPYSR